MPFQLSEDRADRLTLNGPRWLYLGVALGVIAYYFNGPGAGSACMAVWLGACAGSLEKWKTEPGLWMLSALFAGFTLPLYAVFQYWSVVELWQQPAMPGNWLLALDFGTATTLLWIQARFLVMVTRFNFHLSRKASSQ